MQNPFMQHMSDLFSRLRGRTLATVGIVWILFLALALLCAFGAIKLPGSGKTPDSENPTSTVLSSPAPSTNTAETPATGYTAGRPQQVRSRCPHLHPPQISVAMG